MLIRVTAFLFVSVLAHKLVTGTSLYYDCSTDQYRCKTGHCIPKSSLCDGLPDCHDEDDEEHCDIVRVVCDHGEKCETVNECILPSWRCDGSMDCSDSSDETYCGDQRDGKRSACAANEMECEPGFCIPMKWKCDGQPQCFNSLDEVGCERSCDSTDFRCANSLCISSIWRCDGDEDCSDGSDEKGCVIHVAKCKQHEYACVSGDHCILLDKDLCDGVEQCSDGSDEGGRCDDLSMCNHQHHNCSEICLVSPVGPICRCSEGSRLAEDNVTCHSADACRERGDRLCSQVCINVHDRFLCNCVDGYVLNRDGKTCRLKGRQPLLLFASDTVIASFNISAKARKIVKRNQINVYDIAYSDESEKVYWIDVRSKVIYSGSVHDFVATPIVTFGLLHPESLHVDWITRKLYIIDSGRLELIVCSMDGRACSVLVDSLDKPTAIVTDPVNRVMYWSDAGRSPHIKQSSMDGEEQKNIVENGINGAVLKWPNALFIDYVTQRLYWLDFRVKGIQSVHFDGSDRRMILENAVGHYPFSLVVVEGRVIWSDSHQNTILSADAKTGKHRYELMKSVRKPTGLAISHPSLQPRGRNHCKDIWCDICVLSHKNNYKCVCPHGMVLSTDQDNCVEAKQDYLVFSRCTDLIKINTAYIGSQAASVIELQHSQKVFGLVAIPGSSSLIYSDIAQDVINMTHLGDSRQEVEIVSSNLGTVQKIVVDNLMGYIYWTDIQKRTLEVADIKGEFRSTIISSGHGDLPFTLGICKKRSYLIYTNVGRSPCVKRCDLDGTRCIKLRSGIGKIYDLVVDPENCNIYAIVKMYKHAIARLDIDGQNFKALVRDLIDPVALVMLDGNLFWVDGRKMLNIYDIHGDNLIKFPLDSERGIISGTAISTHERMFTEKASDACHLARNSHSRCAQLCFTRPEGGFVCRCNDDMILAVDNTSCVACVVCKGGDFPCESRDQCVAKGAVCDGVAQCRDASDETACSSAPPSGTAHCEGNEFRCVDGEKCVHASSLCDGERQCDDGSDETNCCTSDQFRCIADRSCIHKSQVCDQYLDCPDGADENLPTCNLCSNGKFRCSSHECVDLHLVCNGVDDCSDASDEGLQCKMSCKAKPCEQNCTETPMGPICGCEKGYNLGSSGHTCNDLDECDQLQPVCSQSCINKPGSYLCRCVDGFRLFPDGRSCRLTDPSPVQLLYGVNGRIMLVNGKSESGAKTSVISQVKGSPITIDYNYHETLLYWTSTVGEVMMHNMTSRRSTHVASSITDPYGLAVDWSTGNVYIVDRTAGTLTVCTSAGISCRVIVRSSVEAQLQCVAVHPRLRQLFITSSNKIDRLTMDGLESEVIAYDHSMPANGLAIDYSTDRLYWTNRARGVVETANLDGTKRRTLTSKVKQPFGVDALGDTAVVSDWEAHYVAIMSTFKSTPPEMVLENLKRVLAVRWFHLAKQPPVANACATTKCSHICVPTKPGPVCLCPDGLEFLDESNATCMNCSDYCPAEQTCVRHDPHHVRCVCTSRDCGHQIVKIKPPKRVVVASPDDRTGGQGWVVAVVICVLVFLVVSVVLALYLRRKQRTMDLMGLIRYRNPIFHPKTEECDELVTDLSFRNPGFDDHDINSNKVLKTSNSSESSNDSAFCSRKNLTKISPTPGSYKNFTSEYEY